MPKIPPESPDDRAPHRQSRLATRATASADRARTGPRPSPTRRLELVGAFRDECDSTVDAIRQAVRGLCAAVEVDPLKPQDVARKLKLNKNLTWKFARLLIEEDVLDALPMLPGPEGVAIYMRAFEQAGVDPSLLRSMRDAMQAFDAMVERHFGGRADLELVLDGLRSGANLEQSRRMAFRGMAAVFGVQAAARVTAQIICPNRTDPSAADVGLIVGLVGLRRLRPIARLPVFRSTVMTRAASAPATPLLGGADGSSPDYLIREFSSFPDTQVLRSEADGQLSIELTNGPIGRIGEADLFFGSLRTRSYNLRRSAGDDHAEFLTRVSIPSEALLSDIFVHRSIPGPELVNCTVFGLLSGSVPPDDASREVVRLPIDATPAMHDSLPAESFAQCVETPAVPHYAALLRRAFDAIGADPAEFRLIRVAMPFPPVPSALAVRWPLPS